MQYHTYFTCPTTQKRSVLAETREHWGLKAYQRCRQWDIRVVHSRLVHLYASDQPATDGEPALSLCSSLSGSRHDSAPPRDARLYCCASCREPWPANADTAPRCITRAPLFRGRQRFVSFPNMSSALSRHRRSSAFCSTG